MAAHSIQDTGIYMILNKINGKRYIGSASSFRKRWREHARQLLEGRHHSRWLQRSYDKHGADAFMFHKIIYCGRENLIQYEQAAIDAYKPEYNTALIAGSQLGYRHSPESMAKMSESRWKDFSPMKGRRQSEEARRKISENRKGKGCVPCSDEKKAKLSAAHKGRIITEEQRRKISETLTGRKQSPETIEKRAAKLRGRVMSDEFKQNARERLLGINLSDDHCMNIGKSKAKLTDHQVSEIREKRMLGELRDKLAFEYKVDAATITNVCARNSYRWVE